jgi:protease-4
MGSVAASGGYWVATAGDHIVAEPETITGSIGVFGIVPSFQGSLQKLGVGADGIKTTPLSGEPDVLRGPSPEAGRLIQMSVDNIYRRFLAIVSGSRKLPTQRIDEIAQGRVWDGGTARQLGLVDSFGSIGDAIAIAAKRAKLDPKSAGVAYLEKEPGFIESLLESLASDTEDDSASPDAFTKLAAEPRQMLIRAIDDAERLLTGPAIQVRCLECVSGPAPIRHKKSQSMLAMLASLFRP